MHSLKDKVVVVVGGGTGIGLAIGKAFAEEGCRVVLAGRREEALQAAKALPGVGSKFLTKSCDATDRLQVSELVDWTGAQLSAIDILVFSAGINSPRRAFADVNPEEFDEILNVNSRGAFNCMHAVLPGMRERKSGLIVNIVSVAGLRPQMMSGVAYCASKSAQGAIGTSANLEALPDGVRVTNIFPGDTDTPLLDQRPVPPSTERRAQMLQPEDVASMVVAIAKLPPRAVVPELVITPWYAPFA
jgi:NAD(P)-dependent dehydrogenase (short-subunit alcohol dehydrogenase family)